MTGSRIDLHAHQLPDRFISEYERLTGTPHPYPETSTAAHLAEMDAHGIELAVISLAPPGVEIDDPDAAVALARLINDHFASVIAEHRGRFGALASIPVLHDEEALVELARALDELSLDGVMLYSNVRGTYVGDPVFEPLLAEFDRRGAYVQLHPAEPQAAPLGSFPPWLMEFPFETTRAVATLLFGGALDRYPNIRWHLPHCGGTVPFLAHRLATLLVRDPDLARRVSDDPLRLLGRFYVDTAQSHNEPALAATRALVDVSHIVLGTDWPYAVLADGDDPQPELDELGADIRRDVDRFNALRLVPSLRARLGAPAR